MFSLTRTLSTNARSMSTIGFIGLGNMGKFMAQNLVKGGKSLVVYDLNKDVVKELEGNGAVGAASPAEVAAQSSVIITMVPSSPHITDVFCSQSGVLQEMKAGTLCIDSSTIDPAVSLDISKKVAEKGGEFYDAPVSGGVVAAENGALTFMVGGAEERFEEAKGYLSHMGANIVHCGASGNGLVVKLCNNMMLAISMIGASETLNMGIRMGMDAKLLSSILSTSTGRCWSIDTYNPVPGVLEGVPASRDWQGGFGSRLMLKDLGLATDMAANTESSVPLGDMANTMYTTLCENEDLASKDFGVMYKYIQELEKLKK